jgi:hypothetical protein
MIVIAISYSEKLRKQYSLRKRRTKVKLRACVSVYPAVGSAMKANG